MNELERNALRQRAKQLLEEQPELSGLERLSHADISALIEEMQVYLAELEVQNQQLQDTQLKLNRQQVQYKKLFEHLPIPALLLDQAGIILDNNHQAELFFAHRTTRHLTHHSIFRFLSKNNGQWLFNRLNDRENQEALSAEFDCEVQGQRIPVKVSIMPIKPVIDQLDERQFIITIMDLTAQYQRQKDWQMFQGILDHSSVMIYAFDHNGECLLANQKVAELFGLASPLDVIGQKREQLMSLQDSNRHFQHDMEVIRSKKPLQLKEDMVKNGKILYFLTDKFPLFDSNNQVFAVGGITYDITEQTEYEKQLTISNEIFNKGQDGIMICDPDGLILSVNNSFEKITGYSEPECLKRNPRFLSSGRHPKTFYQAFWDSLIQFGHWRGEIWNKRKSGEIYPQELSVSAIKDTQGNLINYLGVFNDITAKKQAEEEVVHLAFYDGLTGVANRLLLRERTEQLISEASREPIAFSLMFIDLDHFKEVNDVHGHDMGDLLLKQVTQRINQLIRPQDTLARLGGDEFAILFPKINPFNSLDLGERLVTTLAEPYLIQDANLHISASIGIALFPDDAKDYNTLLKHADLAMYHAKQSGRNAVHLFKAELESDLNAKVTLETALREAITKQQLSLVYQPQINLANHQIEGIEALVRWTHPQLGIIAPDQFIPIAERSDQIIQITDWVINQALNYLNKLNQSYPKLKLSVNISAKELIKPDFVSRITQHLSRYPSIEPTQLELEITERIAMSNSEAVLAIFNGLNDLGVQLALDDFGTGYSSLSYLKKYSLQVLKIDKSFVDDIGVDEEDEAVCKAIISLAKSIGYQTIAEGVESQQQVDFLLEQGCDFAQGYYFAKPLSPKDLAAMLATQPLN
ncbi:bifunctional diguanylate cyclase/phosphodiesterase [Thiomicrospira sp. ALE5]|uniref:bifunctional diguanylate cyclase/phosphodiesterase n=1 Tax=Thiomicrospira sp. ALE5 TaxID=748650 RepID=UPI0008F082E3|nr:bifunctional diguanylate cyclase/phosphodiesterase [Thiomicrospira sp. ALE5]SFR53228.1 PAS domain S-box-containing protein/diguanylate cyclase (GGDEF) domain-containing protein [Thiomicrospira sp. ALE5]